MAVSEVSNRIRNDEIEIGFAMGFESMTANVDNGCSTWADEVLALPAGKDATMVSLPSKLVSLNLFANNLL